MMYFENRIDAATQLIPLLKKYKDTDCLVLAVPRGGVPMGCLIAKALNAPLDLLMTKKIGFPENPECAIGAVSLEGQLIDKSLDIDPSYIESETDRLRQVMKERYQILMGNQKPLSVKNKVLIVVDDGIATGYTLMAAIELLRKKNPLRIVVAVPVAPYDTANKIKGLVDDFICLHTPTDLFSISAFYEDFSQVTDDMALQLLKNM